MAKVAKKKVSRATGNRRLLKLADMLIADAKNKKGIQFDLSTVGKPSGGTYWNTNTARFEGPQAEISCGTTACAMGLAAISGKFKKAGLSHKINEQFWVQTTINGRGLEYDRAAMRVFGVTKKEANYLFTPGNYPQEREFREGAKGERYVAKRIRDFVKDRIIPKQISMH